MDLLETWSTPWAIFERSHYCCFVVCIPDTCFTVTLHSWPQCPEGDIRPEAILSRFFGTSCTAIHRQVTLCKGPE